MRSLPAPCKQRVSKTIRRFSIFCLIGMVGAGVFGSRARGDDNSNAGGSNDSGASSEKFYDIDYFSPVFETREGQPTADPAFQANLDAIIGDTEVVLGQSSEGYVAPGKNIPTAQRKIAELNLEGSAQFSEGAILAIDKGIVAGLNARGYGAVLAVPSPTDIDPQDLSDLRFRKKGTLHILVSVPTAGQVRTIASGDRIASNHRIDNPALKRIVHNSPVQATTEPTKHSTPFFNQVAVNDYVDRLDRQPGRRVDVAISAADEPDQYTLDYLVNETKPWYVYAQSSNTGTPVTGEWRERFGFTDDQLTGNDDIINVDGVTDFEKSTNVTGSYELPLLANDPSFGTYGLRVRIYGLWDQYEAADLGVQNNSFSGNDYSGGAEAEWNFFQAHNMFWDFIGGARYQSSQVKSQFSDSSETGNYILPYVGVRVQDNQPTFNYVAALNVQGGITSTSKAELADLGRANPDQDWIILQPSGIGSFYLEPLIDPNDYVAGRSTLANEMYFSLRGQWALNYRLIPQYEQSAGGFYTVRGYPEAATIGDTVFVGTAEYRFHLGRILSASPNPTNVSIFGEPFRLVPQQPYQRPDWDLIARGFVDAGEVIQSRIVTGENNNTLVSAGAGLELQVRQNIDIRGDWGIVLSGLAGTNGAGVGTSRFTLVVTILY